MNVYVGIYELNMKMEDSSHMHTIATNVERRFSTVCGYEYVNQIVWKQSPSSSADNHFSIFFA